MRVTDTSRMRWSLPNTTGLNRSTCPNLSSGQAGLVVSFIGLSPTHRISRPSCSVGSGDGHTQPTFRRRPEASGLRASMMSSGVTPYGRSRSAR